MRTRAERADDEGRGRMAHSEPAAVHREQPDELLEQLQLPLARRGLQLTEQVSDLVVLLEQRFTTSCSRVAVTYDTHLAVW
ncbi:hypothetical protein ACVGVM_29355 (plasmid) [Pseudonocardia bannensis]|uniref:Uncharacterized protein n=1 Tax=Pseudonocardia bannensis TaxID=630973 RepID=A0A848DR07_9PSEU|nr:MULTISPECIES: hypothetical protein [Pseudonocardia]NMH94866.1 hypothetical protein [Pseudonocardia bannensis]